MTPARGPGGASGHASAAAMESLYPFLYAGQSDLDAVMEEVRQSTVAKTAEIAALRREVCARDAARLRACAQDMAGRFSAGGRLLAFGNGGSSTDAQEMATLFLHPGDGMRALPSFCLSNDTAVVTALCNDIGVEVVFARQVAAFGGSPATRAGRWPSSTASTTCSSPPRPRCTGSRRPRPPSTTRCGS